MLFDKWGVVVEVTNKKESNKMPLFFGHSQNSNPDIETVLFFSIDKAMDALFAQSLFSKNAPKLKQRYKIYWIGALPFE